MGIKRFLFDKSLVLHKLIAKRFDSYVTLVSNDCIVTRAMLYDSFSKQIVSEKLKDLDYVRYRTLELVAEEIKRNNIEGCCAEAGVFLGDFCSEINRCFPDRKIYLYDTYEGFARKDLEEQTKLFNMEDLPLSKDFMLTAEKYSAQEQIEIVKRKLTTPQNAIIRKGYFPNTVEEEEHQRFAFVSLDMDYYRPLYEGLTFFWPKMSNGGYIFMHDYNSHSELTEGAHKAVHDAQEFLKTRFHIMPMADYGGTLVIVK